MTADQVAGIADKAGRDGILDRFVIDARKHPKDAEAYVRFRAIGVHERARSSRDPNTTLRDQLPVWVDALYQATIEMVVATNRRDHDEQRNAEQRARFVAERLDDVTTALEQVHLAEDDDERQDHIFAAHKALVRAEAAF